GSAKKNGNPERLDVCRPGPSEGRMPNDAWDIQGLVNPRVDKSSCMRMTPRRSVASKRSIRKCSLWRKLRTQRSWLAQACGFCADGAEIHTMALHQWGKGPRFGYHQVEVDGLPLEPRGRINLQSAFTASDDPA